jgi:hypothetical protein
MLLPFFNMIMFRKTHQALVAFFSVCFTNQKEDLMKPTPFNPETDVAPIPFTDRVCRAAKQMKVKGLPWRPHVGCFVWDEKELIQVSSPFPHRVYFILNVGHFLKRFETIDNIADKLVWLPTWHQARLVCETLNISADRINEIVQQNKVADPETELVALYELIMDHLGEKESR